MKHAVIQGRFCLLADTPADGFELAEMVLEARLVGKHIKIERGNGNGILGVSIPLIDLEMIRRLGGCPEGE